MSLYPVREYSQIDKSKYYHFHNCHNHNMIDCIQLKDIIEGLFNKGNLVKYTRKSKRGREDFPNKKLSSRKKQISQENN